MLAYITNRNLEEYLKCIRSGDTPPIKMLELSILGHQGGISPEARSIKLSEILLRIASESYQQARRSEGLETSLPDARKGVMEQISTDFSLGSSTLEAWSALYMRYFSPVSSSIEDLSSAANVVPQQFRRRLNQGLSFLAEALRRQELGSKKPVDHHLPLPTFTRLVGTQQILQQLVKIMNSDQGPAFVSLEGIGGIGKTAIARAYVSLPETQSRWANILWVSARQVHLDETGHLSTTVQADLSLEDITTRIADQLGIGYLATKTPAEKMDGIRAALTLQPSLVVIDNLETVEDYIQLMPALAQFSGKSRFLITSRQSLREFPFIHSIQLAELNNQSSFELLEMEESRRGRSGMLEKKEFDELYTVVGGIPLAIKLVASQLHIRPLHEILKEFKSASNGIEAFYRFIYWQIWQQLSDQGHRLLLSFLSADPEGEDLEFLQVMSGQSKDEFFAAVKELDQTSLLEISGNLSEPHYRLHRLTVTFLQTELLNLWGRSRESAQ